MKFCFCVFFVFIFLSLSSQNVDNELSLDFGEYELLAESDYSQFYFTPSSNDGGVFASLSKYNFSQQRYLRRGYDYNYYAACLNGISLSDAFSVYPYFTLTKIANNVGLGESADSGDDTFSDASVGYNNLVALSYFNGNAPFAFKVRYGSSLPNGWSYLMYADTKAGRDVQVDGRWGEYYNGAVRASKCFGERASLDLFAAMSYANYSLRSATTQEVYSLVDNCLYNPAWGYYQGTMMSARVIEDYQPSVNLSYRNSVSESTTITSSLSAVVSLDSYNSLSWDDSSSPYPDYYQYLPSFLDQGDTKDAVSEQWKLSNTALTQIDYSQIMQINANSGERALYYMSCQQSDKQDYVLKTQALTTTHYGLTMSAAAEYRLAYNRESRKAGELFGCDYLLDDDGNVVQQGEVFDYDAGFVVSRFNAQFLGEYQRGKWQAGANIEVGYQKNIRYEYLNSSLAESSTSFNPYKLALECGYTLNSANRLSASLSFEGESPYADDLYSSYRYSNKLIDNPKLKTSFYSELNYDLRLRTLKLNLSLYYTKFNNQTRSYSYYDDIYTCYSMLSLSGLSSVHKGVELGFECRLWHGWILSGAGSLNKYAYSSNAQAVIYAQSDGSRLESTQTIYMKDYYVANTPQRVLSLELKYSASYNWMASLTVSHSAGSYVEINPLLRSQKITNAAYYDELLEQLTTQECLPSATVLSVFIYKGFKIKERDLYLTLGISNLLASEVVYSGYEQMRFGVEGSGNATYYTAFANKYLYSYSRSFRASLAYKF